MGGRETLFKYGNSINTKLLYMNAAKVHNSYLFRLSQLTYTIINYIMSQLKLFPEKLLLVSNDFLKEFNDSAAFKEFQICAPRYAKLFFKFSVRGFLIP